jgi:diguanylate cyclase (GGDEF)-like protein
MNNLNKKSNIPCDMGESMTVAELLERHEKTCNIMAGEKIGKPVTIIVLCGDTVPDRLDGTPHIIMNVEDDLLEKIRDLQEENLSLRSLSLNDNLTDLFNRRFFRSQLEIEMSRTKRTGHNCSLMMIDLDNFKLLNDTFGHLEGDRFLAEFAGVMKENVRSTDLIYRYGGDEFSVLMPETSAFEALKTGERFRKKLMAMPQKTSPGISLSIGISEYTPYSSFDMDDFVHSADLAMYEAKKGGKNRVCLDHRCQEAASQDSGVNPEERDFLLRNYA